MVQTRHGKSTGVLSDLHTGKNAKKSSHTKRHNVTNEGDSDDSDSECDLEQLVANTFEHMRKTMTQDQARDSPAPNDIALGHVPTLVLDRVSNVQHKKIEEDREEYAEPKTDGNSITRSAELDQSDETEIKLPTKAKKKKRRTKNKSSKNDQHLVTDGLASELEPGLNIGDLYVNVNTYNTPKLKNAKGGELANSKRQNEYSRRVSSPRILKKRTKFLHTEKVFIKLRSNAKVLKDGVESSCTQHINYPQKERDSTKGKNWFHMAAPEMTEEKKNDLLVLQMRRSLDPKQFYKAPDIRAPPKFFQMGRVVEHAADFYHSRIPKKQRKATLVDELLADAEFRRYNKRKYEEIQESRPSARGAHRHMKRLKKKKR